MIEIENISIAYDGRVVLRDFSAHLKSGSITAITGPNGSGKSSLLSAISGDIELAAGRILINDLDVSGLTFEELAYLRSYAEQSHGYWMAYSVEEILHLGHESISPQRFDSIIDALDISSYLSDSVTKLSGGQLQRVEIARAFMRHSPLVLLDEPFASQDLQSVNRIIDLAKAEKANGTTIVAVTHSHRSDLQWCDNVVEISH